MAEDRVISSDNDRANAGETSHGKSTTVRHDKYRYWWLMGYWPLVVVAVTLWAYFASGGNPLTALIPITFLFVGTPLIDMIIGEDNDNVADDIADALENDPWYRWIIYAMIPQHYFTFVAAIWLVATQGLPLWADIGLIAGVATINGFAIILGHELGHKPKDTLDWTMAKISVGANGYGHFYIEHNRGHHVKVSTPEDCSSAKMGESIFEFALRDIPGALIGGVTKEAERLRRQGHGFWSWRNDILQSWSISLAVAVALVVWLGWAVIPFIALHHLISWYGLTQSNYVAHYGLMREKRANGKYEPCQPRHSWNANHIFSNLMLIDLQRHSDHHANPMRSYPALRNFDDIPRLPWGYLGAMAIANIPPLWFHIMNPKVAEWANGDVSKANLLPRKRDHLIAKYGRKDGGAGAADGDKGAAVLGPAE